MLYERARSLSSNCPNKRLKSLLETSVDNIIVFWRISACLLKLSVIEEGPNEVKFEYSSLFVKRAVSVEISA